MNLQEMKAYKQKLITQGAEAYPTIAKIIDTLAEPKYISGRYFMVLEYDGITAIHMRSVSQAKVVGTRFKGWLYRDKIFVTVGETVPLCPFRRDRVMNIFLDNETTQVTVEDKESEIFVPYHMNWYERFLLLLPKVESILGEASKENNEIEKAKLSKELFLEERK